MHHGSYYVRTVAGMIVSVEFDACKNLGVLDRGASIESSGRRLNES